MTWLALAPAVLLTCLVLFGTGLPLALALRLRGFDAVAVAPALAVTVVAVSAVVAAPLGLRWAWWIPLACGLVAAAALAWADRRWGGENARRPLTGFGPGDLHAVIGVAIGGVLGLWHMVRVLGRPDAFSQTFDNIFHLSTTRVVLESGVASSLLLNGALNEPPTTGFYPAAFHDLAALAALGSADGLTVGVNALLVVLVALVWPLGVLYALRCLAPVSPTGLVGAGALSAAFPAFPLLLLDFGVLYPNLMALALLPVAIGLVAQTLRLAPTERVTRGQGLALGVAVLPGIALAHPNAVITLAALSVPWLIVRVIVLVGQGWSAGRRGHAAVAPWVETAALVAGLAALVWVWPRLRPAEYPWEPIRSITDAAGHAVLNTPPVGDVAWVASALMLVGVLATARRRLLWLLAGWVVLAALWVVVASWPTPEVRDLLTGAWYNDPFRLSATLPLLAIPLAALGTSWLADRLIATSALRGSARSVVGAVVAPAVAAVLIVVGTQAPASMAQAVERAAAQYRITPTSPLVDSDEWTLLNRLTQHVGPDDMVATNPWNGSSLAYAVAGVRTTTKHVFHDTTPELEVINARLDDAATDRSVCPAVRDLGVTYVLDFGTREVHGGDHPYPGLLDMATHRGFETVDREGHAVLYRVTACG